MSKDATATTAQPVDALLDEMERFERVIAALESPHFHEATSATRRQLAWDRRGEEGQDDLPPHLTACIPPALAVGHVLSAKSLPEEKDLHEFAAGLAMPITKYRRSFTSTLLGPPYRSPFNDSFREVVELAGQSKRLRRRLTASLVPQPRSARWRKAEWYSKATEGGLYPDLLSKACREDRIIGRKRRGRNQYDLDSVVDEYPEYSSQIARAEAKDERTRTGANT